jgi:hypothetical protein
MTLRAQALQPGVGYVLSSMTSPAVLGTTIVTNTIRIDRRR